MRARSVVFLIVLSLALPLFAASPQPAKGTVAMITYDGLQKEQVISYSFGVSNVVSNTGGGGGAGKATLSDFTFVKQFNSQSPTFFADCASGRHIATVVVELVDDKGNTVATIKLSDVLVSSYQSGGSNGSGFLDSVSLNFAKIEFLKILIGL